MALIATATQFPLCLPTVKQAVKELEEIFTDCLPIYTDHLSQNQLIPWKEELLQARDGDSRHHLLAKLVYGIGIDALTGHMVRDPVIKDDWVYERSTYMHCREVCGGISPLDGNVMVENPPSHTFLAKVLVWARIVQGETESFAETHDVVLASSTQQYRIFYQKMALCAIQRRESQRRAAQTAQREFAARTALANVDRTIARVRQETAIVLARAELAQIAHEEEIGNRIANLQHMYQGHIAGLQNQIATAEQIHLREIASLREQMAAHDQAEHAIHAMIQAEIARKEEAQRAAREAMAQQIAMVQDTCRNEVRRLEEANDASEARSLKQIHRLETDQTHLRSSLQATESRANSLEGRLTAAEARDRAHEADLASKQNYINHLESRIHSLQDEMDDEPFIKIGPIRLF